MDKDLLLYEAWGIIANAYSGNWQDAPEEWRKAAENWRDKYHGEIQEVPLCEEDVALEAAHMGKVMESE